MTLVGKKSDFWNGDFGLVYFTFIQLADFSGWSYKGISEKIEQVIKDVGVKGSWAVYCSYDFCDLVLFAKNISIKQYNEILWKIALERDSELQLVKDTFTVYGFDSKRLIDAFSSIDSNNTGWLDNMAFSINLSVYSAEAWQSFEKELDSRDIIKEKYRLSGRYDVKVVTKELSGNQIIWLFNAVDKAFSAKGKECSESFGGYEIVPLSSIDSRTISGNPFPCQHVQLADKIIRLLDMLCEQKYSIEEITSYILETSRSLKELTRNGFSLEFVMTVFPSFIAALKNFQVSIPNKVEKEKVEVAVQNYFNALNTLALCTMHGERRFIQAPAFNATYFDIPPKLLALYSALASKISSSLNQLYVDKGKQYKDRYKFLITPDYRPGINVAPIDIKGSKEWLAIIHLKEDYFYDPDRAVYLLSHEIAHYVGKRYRKMRAESIFFIIGIHYLIYSPFGTLVIDNSKSNIINYLDSTVRRSTLLGVLAESICDLLKKRYCEYCISEKALKQVDYQMENLSAFLRETKYGLLLFENQYDKEHLADVIKQRLLRSFSQEEREIEYAVNKIQSRLGACYLTDAEYHLTSEEGKKEIICGVLSEYVLNQLNKILRYYSAEDLVTITMFSEFVPYLYRESYADIRMLELVGCCADFKIYNKILSCDGPILPEKDRSLEYDIRHDAVTSVMFPQEKISDETKKDEHDLIFAEKYILRKEIEKYLRECHSSPAYSSEIEKAVKIYHKGDAITQYNFVLETLAEYKKALFEYCETELEKKPQKAVVRHKTRAKI